VKRDKDPSAGGVFSLLCAMIEKRKTHSPMNSRVASATLLLANFLLVSAASCFVACSSSEMHGAPSSTGAAGALGVRGGAGVAGLAGDTENNPIVVPAGLAVAPRVGNNSAFRVIALTLRQGAEGAELFAAVKNVGDGAGCNVSFSVVLYDKDGGTVGNGISGLLVRRYFELTDGSGNIAGCVAAGEVTMVAITSASLSLDVPIEEVSSLDYMSQYWTLTNVVPITGVSLEDVAAVTRGSGVAYTGTLINGLETEIGGPTVAVFPLDATGRPLAVAYGGSSTSSIMVPPNGTWDFETSAVSEAGVSFDAYPMGGP